MNLEEPLWLVLPPSIREHLDSRTDNDNLLPANMLAGVLDRLRKDKKREEELRELAGQIWEHLCAELPGWGPWPLDVGDCLFIGAILGCWVRKDAPQALLDLPAEEFELLNETAKTTGRCVEQIAIQRIDELQAGEQDDS
jgi:hypothetical protein